MPPAHRRGRRSGPPPRCPGPGRTRDGGGDVHPRALQSLDECGPRERRTIGRGHHLHRVGTARLISCGDRPWSLIIAAGVDVVVDERLFALDPALEAPPIMIMIMIMMARYVQLGALKTCGTTSEHGAGEPLVLLHGEVRSLGPLDLAPVPATSALGFSPRVCPRTAEPGRGKRRRLGWCL
jgi:hypothetical protein